MKAHPHQEFLGVPPNPLTCPIITDFEFSWNNLSISHPLSREPSVVQTSNSAIHRITDHYPSDKYYGFQSDTIFWIGIYPVGSAIQRLNNQRLVCKKGVVESIEEDIDDFLTMLLE